MRTKIMVVTGSGRSATSAVARALHETGWPMGADLLPAHESNPWGHYEDRAAVELNDRILDAHDGTWDCPPDIERCRPDLVGLVIEYVSGRVAAAGGGQWGVKDPRITFTWPYWSEAFTVFSDLEVIRVSNLRDPMRVADSLVARDGGTHEDAVRLATRYQSEIAHQYKWV